MSSVRNFVPARFASLYHMFEIDVVQIQGLNKAELNYVVADSFIYRFLLVLIH